MRETLVNYPAVARRRGSLKREQPRPGPRHRVYQARPTGFNDDKFPSSFPMAATIAVGQRSGGVLHDVSQARAAKHPRDPFRTMAAVGDGLRAALGLD